MANSVLDAKCFHDEAAAFAYVEGLMWPNGPVCPHCGNKERIGVLKGIRTKPTKKSPEGLERHGLRKCYATKCRKTFTVRNGTIFEDSHLALHLWLQVIHLMTSSKKGISTRQIQRLLNCSMKTAWFLTHRIREIMKPTDQGLPPLGGHGVTLEADETYIGGLAGRKLRRPVTEKMAVLTLVERNGIARSTHVPNVRAPTVAAVLSNNARRQSTLMTDEAQVYKGIGWQFARHDMVAHSDQEYVRGTAHTNTVEGFFSILKRGLYGTYQHVSEAHLHRYLNEFDYRYNHRERLGVSDTERTGLAIRNGKGRRLTYRRTDIEEAGSLG
jgi:transposase-like protein